jgi:hypothetical protein
MVPCFVLDLPRRNPNDMDSVADHIGRTASRLWGLGVSERSRLKAANAATIKKYLKPGVIRDLD